MSDRYRSIDELRSSEPRDAWEIVHRRRSSSALIIAIHGGKIEPGTREIAEAIAGPDHSMYAFVGKKAGGNSDLHVTSTRFRESVLMELLGESDIVLSVHGKRDGGRPDILLGGLDRVLIDQLHGSRSSFRFSVDGNQSLLGRDPENVCNLNRRRCGVQIEIPRTLRHSLIKDRNMLDCFAGVLRDAIAATQRTLSS
jgi:phage replication-related protein YjqB (UPF0714/DUF867 family)